MHQMPASFVSGNEYFCCTLSLLLLVKIVEVAGEDLLGAHHDIVDVHVERYGEALGLYNDDFRCAVYAEELGCRGGSASAVACVEPAFVADALAFYGCLPCGLVGVESDANDDKLVLVLLYDFVQAHQFVKGGGR